MTPDAFWAAEMQNRRLQQEQEQYNQRMLMEGITQVAGAYGQYKDDKNQREAMNTTVMAMKDEKIISQDTLDKFLNTPQEQRPFVFDNFFRPQLASWNAGRSAGFQAQAWDKYRQGAPNAGPQSRNKYGYRYQGPQGP
jgi:hypothetical protein